MSNTGEQQPMLTPSQRDEVVKALCQLAAEGAPPEKIEIAREVLVKRIGEVNSLPGVFG